ncbi:MAG: regulatory protein RecX [Clostridiales bacterium]|nr:regulatory protein RecX [Clostridiales bacterium]
MGSREEVYEKAKDAALTYLSYGMRTESQMRNKLREKGFDNNGDECIIDDVIEFLKEYKYIDDLKYAVSYIEYGVSKGHGMLKIKNTLKERGIKRNDIEDAVYEYGKLLEEEDGAFESEHERALREAMKVADGKEVDDKLIAKVGRRLKSRGFGNDAVYYAVGQVMKMKKDGDEFE